MESIRRGRKAAGYSQNELARRLGVSQGAVSQWEKGITHPSFKVLKPLSELLQVPVDELLTEAGNDETANG